MKLRHTTSVPPGSQLPRDKTPICPSIYLSLLDDDLSNHWLKSMPPRRRAGPLPHRAWNEITSAMSGRDDRLQ